MHVPQYMKYKYTWLTWCVGTTNTVSNRHMKLVATYGRVAEQLTDILMPHSQGSHTWFSAPVAPWSSIAHCKGHSPPQQNCRNEPWIGGLHYKSYDKLKLLPLQTLSSCATHFHPTQWLAGVTELTSVVSQAARSEEPQTLLGNAPHPTRGLWGASTHQMVSA